MPGVKFKGLVFASYVDFNCLKMFGRMESLPMMIFRNLLTYVC